MKQWIDIYILTCIISYDIKYHLKMNLDKNHNHSNFKSEKMYFNYSSTLNYRLAKITITQISKVNKCALAIQAR
jgi:hypothetical protein